MFLRSAWEHIRLDALRPTKLSSNFTYKGCRKTKGTPFQQATSWDAERPKARSHAERGNEFGDSLGQLLLLKLGVDDVVVSAAGSCTGSFRFGSALSTGLFVQSGEGFRGLLEIVDG